MRKIVHNNLKIAVDNAKKKYHNAQIQNVHSNIKKLWKMLINIGYYYQH